MELYIRIKDGQPFEHPIFGDNFREAFPDVDVNNLPPEFARFERVERPKPGVYEVMVSDEPTYEFIDGVYKDVWRKRDMTAEEKAATQQHVKDFWAQRPNAENWAAWVFDEATCRYVPPTPCPKLEIIFGRAQLHRGLRYLNVQTTENNINWTSLPLLGWK